MGGDDVGRGGPSPARLSPAVMPGLVPLLSGLTLADRVQGVGTGGFPAHRPDPDTDCGAPARCGSPPRAPRHFDRSAKRGAEKSIRAGGSAPKWADFSAPPTLRAGSGRNDEGVAPTRNLNRTAVDLFRASTSLRRLARARPAPRCRKTWMPGTSPGMTWWGKAGRQRERRRGRRRCAQILVPSHPIRRKPSDTQAGRPVGQN